MKENAACCPVHALGKCDAVFTCCDRCPTFFGPEGDCTPEEAVEAVKAVRASAALHVEDYAVIASMARDIVDRAKEREWLDAMEHHDRQLRALGFPISEPLTEQERAAGRMYRLALHVRRHP